MKNLEDGCEQPAIDARNSVGDQKLPLQSSGSSPAAATSAAGQVETLPSTEPLNAHAEATQQQPHQHKQVRIRWQGHEEEVDEGIADLILALWVYEIYPSDFSEEDEPGMAYIAFFNVEDALQFLNRVAVHPQDTTVQGEDTLYRRITGWGSDRNWVFDAYPSDSAEDEERKVWSSRSGWDTEMAPPDFDFHISMSFPTEDIPLILANLTRSNAPPTGRAPDHHDRTEDAT